MTFGHNDYLQALIEWGVVGAGAIFFVFGGACARLVERYRQSRSKSFSAAAILALAITAAHAIVDFPLQIGAIQVVAPLYLAMAWSPEKAHTSHPRAKAAKRS